jgi:hypothetical protein
VAWIKTFSGTGAFGRVCCDELARGPCSEVIEFSVIEFSVIEFSVIEFSVVEFSVVEFSVVEFSVVVGLGCVRRGLMEYQRESDFFNPVSRMTKVGSEGGEENKWARCEIVIWW